MFGHNQCKRVVSFHDYDIIEVYEWQPGCHFPRPNSIQWYRGGIQFLFSYFLTRYLQSDWC